MENTLRVIQIILPVLVALGLGALSRRLRILTPEQVDGLKTFIVIFSLPAVLFGAFYRARYDFNVLVITLFVYAACTLLLFMGKLVQKSFKANRMLPFFTTGFECGMMGYALYTLLFGAENLSSMAVVALGEDLFVFTLYMALLKRQNGVAPREVARQTLTSPIFIAIVLGVLLGALGLGGRLEASSFGGILSAVVDFLGQPTAYGILFVVGYSIEFSGQGVKAALGASAARILCLSAVLALLLFLLGRLGALDSLKTWALILMFSLPAPYVLPVFVQQKTDERYASTCLSLYTLFSIVLFVVIAAIAV